jgi:hypothetical protein
MLGQFRIQIRKKGSTSMMDWIADNKEWIFSGVGISVLTIVFLILRHILRSGTQTNHADSSSPTGKFIVDIDGNSTVSGNIASRDITIFQAPLTPPSPSTSIEQYRGNLMSKFKGLYDCVNFEIDLLKNEKGRSGDHLGLCKTSIMFLENFRSSVKDVEMRVHEALDNSNLVMAHETLNELRKMALKATEEWDKYCDLFKEATTMCETSCRIYGMEMYLREKILDVLTPFCAPDLQG